MHRPNSATADSSARPTWRSIGRRVSSVNSIFIGASNQLGEFESGATAALLGPVGSAVLGGIGTMLVAVAWVKVFPALARRDRITPEDGLR